MSSSGIWRTRGEGLAYPENLRDTVQGTGGTETRPIFGVRAYSLSDAPTPGRIVA